MNNKGVSAVMDVVFMVAITVAIAALVYVYVCVSDVETSDTPINEGYFYGQLKNITHIKDEQFLITFIDNTAITVLFDRYADDFYSFDIGNTYLLRIARDNRATLVVEIKNI